MRKIQIATTHTSGASITIGEETHIMAGLPCAADVGSARYDYLIAGWKKPLGKRLQARLITAANNYARRVHGWSYCAAGNGWTLA